MTDKRDWTALIITVCAVITAMPRWIGALLASEGFTIPASWLPWWIVASTVFSAAMAITEGVAFAYVFNAWRNQKDRSADNLLWFAGISGVTFIVVLAPFIAAQTRASNTPLAAILSNDIMLWIWSVGVAASTIVIVASVGYAQKRNAPQVRQDRNVTRQEPEQGKIQDPASVTLVSSLPKTCPGCGKEFSSPQGYSGHLRFCEIYKQGQSTSNGTAKLAEIAEEQ